MGRLEVGVVASLLLLASACGDDANSPPENDRVPDGEVTTVARVVDGDTIVVDDDRRVRLTGIDTPETVDPRQPVQCFGEAASRETKRLLPAGTRVVLVADV